MSGHGKSHFFKYLSSDTARIVLANNTLRYSSPRLFNDPFDVQFDLQISFERADLVEASRNRYHQFLSTGKGLGNNQVGNTAKLFAWAIRPLRKGIEEGKLTIDQVMRDMDSAFSDSADKFFAAHTKVMSEIRASMADVAVLCVSEVPDNILMWSHYAENHMGVVIRLECQPEVDNPILVASPITYSDEMPKWHQLDTVIDENWGVVSPNHRLLLDRLLTTKAIDWAYEKEWRVIIHNELKLGSNHSDFGMAQGEIDQVILGCRMPEPEREKIIAICNKAQPQAEVLIAEKQAHAFELALNPVG